MKQFLFNQFSGLSIEICCHLRQVLVYVDRRMRIRKRTERAVDLIPHLHESKADDDGRWSVAWLSLFEAVRDGDVT